MIGCQFTYALDGPDDSECPWGVGTPAPAPLFYSGTSFPEAAFNNKLEHTRNPSP